MAHIVVASFVLSTQNMDIEDESESDDSDFEIVEQIPQQRRHSINDYFVIWLLHSDFTLNIKHNCTSWAEICWSAGTTLVQFFCNSASCMLQS